ncbi:flagellar hook-length control protein FliK [Bacillaceae bacterium S4-13-58]
MNTIIQSMPTSSINSLFMGNKIPEGNTSPFSLLFSSETSKDLEIDTLAMNNLTPIIEDLLRSISKLLNSLQEGEKPAPNQEEKELESISQLIEDLSSQNQLFEGIKRSLTEEFATFSSEEKMELLTFIKKHVIEMDETATTSNYIQSFFIDTAQVMMTPNFSDLDVEKITSITQSLYTYSEMISKEVNRFLAHSGDSTEQLKAAALILQQLRELTSFLKQQSIQVNDSSQLFKRIFSGGKLESNQQEMIQILVQNYLRRTSTTPKGNYVQNATVTTQDISKWITQAMERQGMTLKTTNQTLYVPEGNSMPMSKIEQYIIRLPVNQQQQRQFLQEFQKVVQKSQFLQQGGVQQLSIRLQPENLGNMLMRFVEVDGEMVVKITVTSLAAKELLEGNLHQLKHMFSPHQVVVEKQETLQQQSFLSQKQQEQLNKEQQSRQEQQQQQRQENPKEDHEESVFKEFLLNMKV